MIKNHYVKHHILILTFFFFLFCFVFIYLFFFYKSKKVKSNNVNNEIVIEYTIKNKFKWPNFNKLLTYFWQRTKGVN